MDEETLGDRMRRLRRDRGLSVGDLAEKMGVSRPTIWSWEHGKSLPRPQRIANLAASLNVPEDELIMSEQSSEDDEEHLTLEAAIAESKATIARLAGITPDKVEIVIRW